MTQVLRSPSDSKLDQQSFLRKRHMQLVELGKPANPKSFYQVANGQDLMKLCLPYLEDFKNGTKSFAVTSTNYKTSQQRMVLGLATYFDHLCDMRILVVSDSLQKGVFRELVDASQINSLHGNDGPHGIVVHRFHHHFDFIEIPGAASLEERGKLDEVLDEYDLVLWDPPVLSVHRSATQFYPLLSRHFGSLSVVVASAASKKADLDLLKRHFDAYGISIADARIRMQWL